MKVLFGLLLVTVYLFPTAMFAAEEVHEMQKPIQIEGTFQARLSPSEKQKRQRKLLEKRTEALVQRQIETLRLRQEIELAKKLRALEKQLEKKLDNELENI